MRGRRLMVLALAGLVLASGCRYFPQAVRGQTTGTSNPPWWCSADGTTLVRADCDQVSLALDVLQAVAEANWYAATPLGQGHTAEPYEAGVGTRIAVAEPTAS